MSRDKHYWEIGHKDPDDIIWLFDGQNFNEIRAGEHSHESLFGRNYESFWRGRYEKSTGVCSIAPPDNWQGYRRPPQFILDMLKSRFSVFKFYFFSDGVESFTPNPALKGMRA